MRRDQPTGEFAEPNRVWTVREMALHNSIGGRSPVVVARRGTWRTRWLP